MDKGTEILVAGAGLAGVSAALALARAGHDVVLAGPLDTRAATRTVALMEGSLRFFEALGLRASIEAQGAALRIMRIVDDTGSLFAGSPSEFDAGELGLDAFGWNIENAILLTLLAEAARGEIRIRWIEGLISAYTFEAGQITATFPDGGEITAKLLLACDGYHSLARESAGLKARTWSYPQTALTAILTHSVSHRNVSTEFHTREGPCTFVPLPDAADGAFRSSLVWVMHPREARRRAALETGKLTAEIERAAHHILGSMTLQRGPGFVPMEGLQAKTFSGPRIALAGEAAHAFPPIGAQGLNLGLRDVAHLCDALHGKESSDPGAPEVLARYESLRRGDIASRTFGVDLLNRALLTPLLPVDLARAIGQKALTNIGPVRRLAMREGIMPRNGAPSMMLPAKSAS